MLYTLIRGIAKLALSIYFKNINTINLDRIPQNRPVLLVPNHPGAFMDPTLIATLLKHKLTFIARGESFNSRLKRWFFSKLNMKPIYRKEFSPNLTHKNVDMINAYQQILGDNNTIVVFPEDIKKANGKRLRKIKTGAARIILGFEEKRVNNPNDFPSELLVIPIGINYTNPHEFRSEVFVNVGDPIDCSEFFKLNKTDNQKAVQTLTQRIETVLKELTIYLEAESSEVVFPKVEEIFKAELIKEAAIKEGEAHRVFNLRKALLNGMEAIHKKEPKWFKQTANQLNDYFDALTKLQVSDQFLKADFKAKENNLFAILLGLPIFLYGWINHFPSGRLTKWIVKKFTRRDDFYGAMTFSMAIFCFPICYILQILMAFFFLPNGNIALVYMFTLPFSGLFMIYYQPSLQEKIKEILFRMKKGNNDSVIKQLQLERVELLNAFREARKRLRTYEI